MLLTMVAPTNPIATSKSPIAVITLVNILLAMFFWAQFPRFSHIISLGGLVSVNIQFSNPMALEKSLP